MSRLSRHALAFFCSLAALPAAADREDDLAAIEAYVEHVERSFADADLEAAMELFTDDAVILQESGPDIVGKEAIRAVYSAMLATYEVAADLTSEVAEISGDMAVEHGMYTLRLTDRASGQVAVDTRSRYLHVFKRQPDGSWKTWRMMVNTPEAPATQ